MPTQIEALLMTSEQMPDCLHAADSGDTHAATVTQLVTAWFKQMLERNDDKRFMCVACDAEFSFVRTPRALLLMIPLFEDETSIVTGICKRCYDSKCEPRWQEFVMEQTRKLMPDATLVSENPTKH